MSGLHVAVQREMVISLRVPRYKWFELLANLSSVIEKGSEIEAARRERFPMLAALYDELEKKDAEMREE